MIRVKRTWANVLYCAGVPNVMPERAHKTYKKKKKSTSLFFKTRPNIWYLFLQKISNLRTHK